MVTSSGRMLLRTPPWMVEIDSTAGEAVDSIWRVMTVCSARMICAEVTTGSIPRHGDEPWVWRP